ncbi:MAG: TolC family protein [Phycisphaerae bacterium]|nr:TolC family protein [Phycisphaerae bacterium]
MKTKKRRGASTWGLGHVVCAATFGWALIAMCMVGGCSTEHFKEQADKEVYQILENKWRPDFGTLANYQINDGEPNQTEIMVMVPSSGVVNLADAVGIATRFNRSYQREKESLYLSALNLTDTRHRYEQQWFGTVDATYRADGERDTETAVLDSTIGVNKQFLLGQGVQIGTRVAVDWARFLLGDPRTSLGSVMTATLTAPLLGAGAGKAALENLTQAERSVLYRIRSFNRYRQQFVTDMVDAYYGVLLARARLDISEASHKRLVLSTDQIRMEVEVGRRPAYDLGEAEQSLLASENRLITARQGYEQTLDNFKMARLSLPTEMDITLDQNELAALEAIGVTEPEYTEEEAIALALERRLDLANTRDGVFDVERKLILAAEGLGPQIALVGSANAGSTPETDWTRMRFHDGIYSLGIQADLALDQKGQRNAYREALIRVQQSHRNYDEQVEQINLDVRKAYRDLRAAAETHRIQTMGLALAKQRVEVEKLSLEFGRGTVRLLLNSEDSLREAENAAVEALVNHTNIKLRFFRDIGVLQVKPDGMWEQTAK